MGTVIVVFVVVLIFAAIGGGLFAVYTLLTPTRTATDRLRELTPDGPGFQGERDEAVDRIAERLGALAATQDEEERNKMRLMMIQAGYTSRRALDMFNAIRVALAIGLPVLIVPVLAGSNASLMKMFGFVVISGAAGYYVPGIVVGSQADARKKRLMAPFPDALDMLVSSVEAGLGLDAAFRRVADELEAAAPELSREFNLVNAEISAGVTRIDALKHLAERTGLDEVSALVNMLVQADRFGTSIARSLRVHSSITRQKRMSKAEEEAAKVSPKLTVVMILFLMPCLMIVLLGPAIIRIKRVLIDGGQ